MKVVLVNKFFYRRGGAETYFFEIARLLRDNGHQIYFFAMDHPLNNDTEFRKYFVSRVDYEASGLKSTIKSSMRMLYSLEARQKMEKLVKRQPDVVHLNNIYHQISPSILSVITKRNIASVMTLHDLKMVCGSYAMMAREKICEACKGGKHYHCFMKACLKNSRLKSLLVTIEMYLHHRILDIYDQVDLFISPSKFLKSKLREMGFRREIIYLPNFVKPMDFIPQYNWEEKSIAYVGRLSRDKGIMTLIESVRGIKDLGLKVIGDGPFRDELRRKVQKENIENVKFLGFKAGEELRNEIKRSMFVVVPSELYENSPMTVLESFALGKPVIGSRIGGIPELIKDKETGLTFEAGNRDDLREKMLKLAADEKAIRTMGMAARKAVEEKFNEEMYYERLVSIYQKAINIKRCRSGF